MDGGHCGEALLIVQFRRSPHNEIVRDPLLLRAVDDLTDADVGVEQLGDVCGHAQAQAAAPRMSYQVEPVLVEPPEEHCDNLLRICDVAIYPDRLDGPGLGPARATLIVEHKDEVLLEIPHGMFHGNARHPRPAVEEE